MSEKILWPSYLPDIAARSAILEAVEEKIVNLHNDFYYHFQTLSDKQVATPLSIDKHLMVEVINKALKVASANVYEMQGEELRLEHLLLDMVTQPYRDMPQHIERISGYQEFQTSLTDCCTYISDKFLRAKREYQVDRQQDERRGEHGF